MLRTYLVLCGLVLSGSAFAVTFENGNDGGVAALCATTWRSDYEMREHCESKQGLSLINVQQILNWSDDETRNIIVMCVQRWEKEALQIYDWEMVEDCMYKNMEALKRLND